MSDYENSILSAIDIMVNNAVSNATYDRTIIATVLKHTDEETGKYRLQYQDSTFYAYSTNNIKYIDGSKVYVLIPGNDFTNNNKVILGESTKNSSIVTPIIEESELNYTVIGGNCIDLKDEKIFRLTKNEMIPIYLSDGADKIDINDYFINGVKSCDSLILGCKFRTNIPLDNRTGEYGIILGIDYTDGENTVTEYYSVNSKNINGNPFKFTSFNRRYHIYNFNNNKFKQINSIYLYAKDFITEDDSDEFRNKFAIDFTDIELKCAQSIDNDDINGTFLKFNLPKGNTIKDEEDKIPIVAAPRIDGKILNVDALNLFYYWFIEDGSISYTSDLYSSVGGLGWRCLNEKQNGVFLNSKKQFFVSSDIVKSSEENIKCVVLYGDYKLSKTIKIKNISKSAHEILLKTNNGITLFHNENYRIDIICYPEHEYNNWSIEDKNGNVKMFYTDLSDDFKELYDEKYKQEISKDNILELIEQFNKIDYPIELNSGYGQTNFYVDGYSAHDLKYKKQLKEEFDNLINKNLLSYEDSDRVTKAYEKINNLILDYNLVTYVDDNKLCNFNTSDISEYVKIKCTTEYGTGTLVLNNVGSSNQLIINNGDQMFQYTYSGISPADESLENRIEIKPLSFTFRDDSGKLYTEDDYDGIDSIVWKIPSNNSFLTYESDEVDISDGYYMVSGETLSTFGIKQKYSSNYYNNQIELYIVVNGKEYHQKTNFSFTKSGEIGTNGTEYTSRIKIDENDSTYFYLMQNGKEFLFNGYSYKLGEKIVDDSISIEKEWSVKSSTNKENEYIKLLEAGHCVSNNVFASPCFIQLKTTIKDADKTIVNYTVEPIAYIEYTNQNDRKPITINSGLKYIMYDSGGNNPIYNTDNIYSITVNDSENEYYLDCIGNNVSVNANSVTEIPSHIDGNTFEYYVTGFVRNKESKDLYATIYFPIYTYLTKNGLPGLDDWDGNSIDLGEKNGVILAPQVGAGKKEEDNSFTGALMGTQRINKKNDEFIDITGVLGFNHGNRSFLLDSDTGGAVFGSGDNGGRIAIDVRDNDSEIYSSNYYTNESYDDKGFLKKNFKEIKYFYWYKSIGANGYERCNNENDLMLYDGDEPIYFKYYDGDNPPASIKLGSDNESKLIKPRIRYDKYGNISSNGTYIWIKDNDVQTKLEGMRIDLADGKILWGNGQFGVDEKGFLTAKTAQVGNWNSESSYFRAKNFEPIIDNEVGKTNNFAEDSDIDSIGSATTTVEDNETFIGEVTSSNIKPNVTSWNNISSLKTKATVVDDDWNKKYKNIYELNQSYKFLMSLHYNNFNYIIFKFKNLEKYFAMQIDNINIYDLSNVKKYIIENFNKTRRGYSGSFRAEGSNGYRFCKLYEGIDNLSNDIGADDINIMFTLYDRKNIPLYIWNDVDVDNFKNLHMDNIELIPLSYENSNIFITNYRYIASAINITTDKPIFNISQNGRLYTDNIIIENGIGSPGRDSLTDLNSGFRINNDGLSINIDKYHLTVGKTDYPGIFLTPLTTSYIRQLRIGKADGNSIFMTENGALSAKGAISTNSSLSAKGTLSVTGGASIGGTLTVKKSIKTNGHMIRSAAYYKEDYFSKKGHNHDKDYIKDSKHQINFSHLNEQCKKDILKYIENNSSVIKGLKSSVKSAVKNAAKAATD